MSVIFSAVLLGLNHLASAVINITQNISQNDSFELSQDGESVFFENSRYDYVGYCDGGTFPSYIEGSPGRRLGYLSNDNRIKVWQLDTPNDIFILVGVSCDCADIYRLSR